MAARLRSGLILATTCLAAGAALYACEPEARPVGEVLDAILTNALGGDLDRFDRLALELHDAEDDARKTTVLLDETGRTRITWPDGSTALITTDAARGWVKQAYSEPLDAETERRARSIGALCRAAFYAPLVARDGSEFTIDHRTIALPNGWTLEHDGDDPVALRSETHGTVRFVTIGRPPEFALPREIDLDPLGRVRVHVLGDDVVFGADTFVAPEERGHAEPDFVIGGDEPPGHPVFVRLERCKWFVVDDPGTWAERLTTIQHHGTKLAAQGQANAGDPILFDDDGQAKLAIPFRPSEGAAAYLPARDEDVRDAAARAAAIVYCEPGPFAERVANGKQRIEAFLAQSDQRADGPLRTIVNIFFVPDLTEGSRAERTMEVRLEQPIRYR